MKFTPIDPPRVFDVGRGEVIQIKDCGRVELQPDEQVTFMTERGVEYDVARKSWGFYATPSLNGRLQGLGLRGVLIKNPEDKFYIFLVESGKEVDFERYLEIEDLKVVCWMDTDDAFETLQRKLDRA